MEAKIILQKCSDTQKTAGLRIQKINGDWYRTWAFPIDEKKAKSEGFDKEDVSGAFYPTEEFPGCPYCGNMNFFQCGMCGHITCLEGSEEYVTCAWCGNGGTLTATDSFDVSGGGY